MSATDRAKEALLALLGYSTPRLDFYTTYRAKMVKQSGDLGKVDLKPDDARIPDLQNVRIKWGLPGVTAQVQPGCFMHLGWENGDPSKPYAELIEGGATVIKMVIKGSTIYVGDESGAEPIPLGTTLKNHLTAVKVFLDALTLPVSGGSAGPPAAPSPNVPAIEAQHGRVA